MTRTPTITQLEERLSFNQVKEARIRTIEKLDGKLAVSKGMKYLARVLQVYEECLTEEYEISKLRGNFVRKDYDDRKI